MQDLAPNREKFDVALVEALKKIPRRMRSSLNQGYLMEAWNDENNKTLGDVVQAALKKQAEDEATLPRQAL